MTSEQHKHLRAAIAAEFGDDYVSHATDKVIGYLAKSGYVIVPVQPTKAMFHEARIVDETVVPEVLAHGVWDAMLRGAKVKS